MSVAPRYPGLGIEVCPAADHGPGHLISAVVRRLVEAELPVPIIDLAAEDTFREGITGAGSWVTVSMVYHQHCLPREAR